MPGLVLLALVVGFVWLTLRVRRNHRELRSLSAQLMTEQRIELHTRATLRAMRDAAGAARSR